MTHVESPWLPVHRVSVNTAARAVTGMNSCAGLPGKNGKAVCGSRCCVFAGSSLSSCHEHGRLRKQTQQLSSIPVFGTRVRSCVNRRSCVGPIISLISFSLLGLAWILTWKLKPPGNASLTLLGQESNVAGGELAQGRSTAGCAPRLSQVPVSC